MNLDAELRAAVARPHEWIDRYVAAALALQRAKNPRRVVGQWARRDRARTQRRQVDTVVGKDR